MVKFYGRGATDMKEGHLASLIALESLIKLQSVVEEESVVPERSPVFKIAI